MSLLRRSTSSAVIALAIVLTLALAVVLAATGQSSSADTSGVLDVGDNRYEFVPTACTATDNDFVAAGSGTTNGESFWISATSRSMTLTVGTQSEVARPDADNVWLTSLGQVTWSAGDGQIDVDATMVDSRNEAPERVRGSLTVICPTST